MTEKEFLIKLLKDLLNDLQTNPTVTEQANQKEQFTLTLDDIVDILAQKLNIHPDAMPALLQKLYRINPGACLSLFAKELAIQFDLLYPDHITESDKFFVLSLLDGRIHECVTPIKNHECVALFRTLDDAKLACKVLKPMLKDMYGKQKDKKHQ